MTTAPTQPAPGTEAPVASGAVLTLGDHGYDAADKKVWAVLNHNSDFSSLELQQMLTVPEPASIALTCVGVLFLLLGRKWVKRRKTCGDCFKREDYLN